MPEFCPLGIEVDNEPGMVPEVCQRLCIDGLNTTRLGRGIDDHYVPPSKWPAGEVQFSTDAVSKTSRSSTERGYSIVYEVYSHKDGVPIEVSETTWNFNCPHGE